MKNLLILIFTVFLTSFGFAQQAQLTVEEIASKEMENIERMLNRGGTDVALTDVQTADLNKILHRKAIEVEKLFRSPMERIEKAKKLDEINATYDPLVLSVMNDKQKAIIDKRKK